MISVELFEPICKYNSLPVDRKYQKGQAGILLLFYYLIQYIYMSMGNVDFSAG